MDCCDVRTRVTARKTWHTDIKAKPCLQSTLQCSTIMPIRRKHIPFSLRDSVNVEDSVVPYDICVCALADSAGD